MLPPDEATALAKVKLVQALNGTEIQARVRAEIGDPLLAMFALLAKNVAPEDDDRETTKKVQLMILAYLVRGELQAGANPASTKGKKG